MSYYCNGLNFDATVEDIVRAAREFGQRMREMGREFGRGPEGHDFRGSFHFYPPANIFKTRDGSLALEFDLSGIDPDGLRIEFQGDYLVLSAKSGTRGAEAGENGYYRRSFRPRDIDRQKYYVPADEYLQDQSRATFKNGALTIVVPPSENERAGIKITIEKEGA
jgi:HSP20 family protein